MENVCGSPACAVQVIVTESCECQSAVEPMAKALARGARSARDALRKNQIVINTKKTHKNKEKKRRVK